MSVPPRKFAPKLEVLWRDTSPNARPDQSIWLTGIIANGKPKAPFFCQKQNSWLYPVIVDRPTGPRILQWIREDAISGCQPRLVQRGVRPKAVL